MLLLGNWEPLKGCDCAKSDGGDGFGVKNLERKFDWCRIWTEDPAASLNHKF